MHFEFSKKTMLIIFMPVLVSILLTITLLFLKSLRFRNISFKPLFFNYAFYFENLLQLQGKFKFESNVVAHLKLLLNHNNTNINICLLMSNYWLVTQPYNLLRLEHKLNALSKLSPKIYRPI